ncbi:transposon Tf2-9 polyprotein [Trichonephila clavata]|uniref:RNA-directed DNA polymerase n=1 Tax=Trichonephila clavata TaxID=2740835 RepID=A0A8X6HN45_TRICU|nr:transposon Tf2-9 polyprotein [Trichonephila clavata]
MKTSTTKKTIECLRDSFAIFGLPRVLYSDNGSQFTSYEFQRFTQSNGVKHKTSAPFKPSSNGQAERFVATLKQSFRAMHKYEDFLSRLPKTSAELEVKDDITIFQMSQIEALPVTSKELRQETGKDIELVPLLKALREGKDLQGREAQYTIEDGCIMYGQRACIFQGNLRRMFWKELHAGHLGIVKMKAIARSFVYWKDIDKGIEEAAKNCVYCARYKADPTKAKIH